MGIELGKVLEFLYEDEGWEGRSVPGVLKALCSGCSYYTYLPTAQATAIETRRMNSEGGEFYTSWWPYDLYITLHTFL